ncbi:MAG: AI-2E family transporter [Bacteroidia bacterium]|nr:AI-2E family transporter [Bacteroidia bacterium]
MQSKSKYFLIAFLIAVLLLITLYLKSIVLYIVIAIVISLIGQPIVKFYSKIKIKNFKLSSAICVLLSLLTMVFFAGLLVAMFVPLIIEEARVISQINSNDVIAAFQQPLNNLEYTFRKFQIVDEQGESLQNLLSNQLSSILNFKDVSSAAGQVAGFTGSLIGGTFAVLFMTFFFMKDEQLIYRIILLLTPPKYIENVKEILRDTKRLLTRYFIGILLDMLFVATLTFIGLSIVGVKNALLIGMFAGLMNIIPYIGPLIGILFGLLIGVTSSIQADFQLILFPLIGKIAMVFLVVQIIDAMFFQPMVIANIVKAHPLEIFIVILIAGTLVGIGGMVVAVPVYTILRIISKEFLSNFQIVQRLTANLEEEEKGKS